MLKIEKIVAIKPYKIICLFNNGIEKTIDILPLLENHKHLLGIEKLKNETVFNAAQIGKFGEIYWKNIIQNNKSNELWDYDISPEFVFYQNQSEVI